MGVGQAFAGHSALNQVFHNQYGFCMALPPVRPQFSIQVHVIQCDTGLQSMQ